MSAWWLLLIVPASAFVGYMAASLCVAAKDADRHLEERKK